MPRTDASARVRRRSSPSASARLPSRTVSCSTASAAGMPRSSSIAAPNAAGSSAAASTAPSTSRGPVEEALDPPVGRRGLGERLLGVLDVGAVVGAAEVVAQLDRTHPLHDLGHQQAVAERLAHLLAGRRDPGVVHPGNARTAGRPPSTGRSRSRGGGSAGRCRRRGCRTRRRGTCRPSPSTRGASPGGPLPTAWATTARLPAWRPSTARSRAGRACRAGRRRWRAPSRRPSCRSAGRTPATTGRRSRRHPSRPRRRRRARAR